MPSPNTSAQGAPVASQEAEARFDETAENALRFFGLDPRDEKAIGDQLALMFVYVDDGSQYSWETRDALHTGLVAAYAAAIRTSERERYAALVKAATKVQNWMGQHTSVRDRQSIEALATLSIALAALEEVGSAQ